MEKNMNHINTKINKVLLYNNQDKITNDISLLLTTTDELIMIYYYY